MASSRWVPPDLGIILGALALSLPWAPFSPSWLLFCLEVLWLGMGAHGWVAKICQPWKQSSSRSWLLIVEVPGCLRHNLQFSESIALFKVYKIYVKCNSMEKLINVSEELSVTSHIVIKCAKHYQRTIRWWYKEFYSLSKERTPCVTMYI